MKNHSLLLIFLSLLLLASCEHQGSSPKMNPEWIGKVVEEMTEMMVHDVTNPPLAARFFSYACLSGYEVYSFQDSSLHSMHGTLNNYPKIKHPQEYKAYSPELASVLAMIHTASKMQPSGSDLQQYQASLLDSCRQIGFDEERIAQSIAYAEDISTQILQYAKEDGYNQTTSYPRYTPVGSPGSWYPTPPGYFPPVEPHFNSLRPFFLDSAQQFKPLPPVAYSEEKDSEFFQILEEVYHINLNDTTREIAAFWDCNPFALQDNGHLMVGMKKISPGAHWMGITTIACTKAELNFGETLKRHTMVAVTLMDGFIACWDEKYRSNRIRPETAIRKLIDPTWTPLLQTPPFPEYLSGHSTVSTAASVVLTHYFGDNFQYEDTVEERYGLAARPYNSFIEAAEEAAISRLYGGIHYMDAITRGQTQGRAVGNWIIDKVE
ncbi:vanadium-dependent haloperoxidase [Echinicola pacifica]|nr:vanadium-dependent haloperoxidase [Echinicola pacifica]